MAADMDKVSEYRKLVRDYQAMLIRAQETTSERVKAKCEKQAFELLNTLTSADRSFESTTDRWGEVQLSLVLTDDEKLAEDELKRQAYTGMYHREIANKRAQIKSRLESEIRSLQQLQQKVDAGEWGHIYSSELKSSNRTDLIDLIDSSRLMEEMLDRLGDERESYK